MGMKERVKAGLWMGGGRVPFGYDYDKEKGILVPNKDAEKVKQIYDLYLKGYSGQNIANILGLKYERLAMQILKRKSNYGIIEYNGEEYQGKHEPIISKETYDLAMNEMAKRSISRTTSGENLLTGLVYCGKCGAKMHYQKWGKKGSKFACYSQQSSKPYLVKDPNCDQEKYWVDDIEREVINRIFLLKEQEHKDKDKKIEDTNVIDVLNTQKKEVEKKIKRLYNLYAESDDDILLDTIQENKKQLDFINNKIQREIESNVTTTNKDKVKKYLDTLQENWEYMTDKEKQTIVRSIVNKVIITGNEIRIVLNF